MLAKLQLNDNAKRDGVDISNYFFNPEKEREPRPYFYWHVGYIQAIRYGDWKLNMLGGLSKEEQQNILNNTYNIAQFAEHNVSI